MKKIGLTFLFAVACVCCLSVSANAQVGERRPPTLPTEDTSKKPAAAPHTGWRVYRYDRANFSAAFPAPPVEESERVRLGNGMQTTTTTLIATNDYGVFMVAYMDALPINAERMPERTKQQFYEEMWRGVMQGVRQGMEQNGVEFPLRPLASRGARVGGLSGREQDFTLGPLDGKAQMTLAGDRAYLIVTMLTEETPATERNNFFNSFSIQHAHRSGR